VMPETKKTFYVTTPIYYVNDVPHIGHAYSTVGADALARFKRMDGYEVFFLTGTDEHGQKIARTALEEGIEPKQLADRVVERFKEAWTKLGISNDYFIRTTDANHGKAARAFFKRVMDAGFIYKADYEGWYCLPDEKFLLDSEVVDGKCPDCGRPVERIKEQNYFFKMSAFQKQLERHLEEHPEFIQPASRKNELINNFIKPGLADVSITRSSVKWGVQAPVPETAVIYVWFDALVNYLSALGWPDGENYKKFWPADVHIIGKDILRFHTTIWPTALMAAGILLPKKIFGTGYINKDGKKMSKSLGNVVDPFELAATFSPDALRYYLLREIPFGLDGNYTDESFQLRFNGDLANDLGNLVHRSLTMVEKYFEGVVPKLSPQGDLENQLAALGKAYAPVARKALDNLEFHSALAQAWELVKRANKYIEESAPWKVAKEGDAGKEKLSTIMYSLMESLRVTAISIAPFLPFTASAIWSQLGYSDDVHQHSLKETEEWGKIPAGQKVIKNQPLFPRIEKEKKK
jgi:methionyl-tRNA synthetase